MTSALLERFPACMASRKSRSCSAVNSSLRASLSIWDEDTRSGPECFSEVGVEGQMGGPQDTRLRTELGGKDFKVFHQRGGELGFHDFLQGLEKQGFGLGHAPPMMMASGFRR